MGEEDLDLKDEDTRLDIGPYTYRAQRACHCDNRATAPLSFEIAGTVIVRCLLKTVKVKGSGGMLADLHPRLSPRET